MWKEALSDCLLGHHLESRVGKCHETIGYAGQLINIDGNWLTNERRALSPAYAAAEFLWYMSREGNITMLKEYAPSYIEYAEPDGKAFGAYGSRLAGNLDHGDLLEEVIKHLRDTPMTRQAVISLWKASDLVHAITGVVKDIPCTISWQFLRRKGELHMITNMRSNDVWKGMPYDVFVFTCIQHMLAGELSLRTGSYTHIAGSMHLYDKNRDAAVEALTATSPDLYHNWEAPTGEREMLEMVKTEKLIRELPDHPSPHHWVAQGDMADDMLRCIHSHYEPNPECIDFQSPALSHGVHVHADHRRKRSSGKNDIV